MKLLLHACCGVCALEPVRLLQEEGIEFGIDYTNPNIHPQGEYKRRLDAIKRYVIESNGLPFFEGAYDPEEWERVVGTHGLDREARCRACYRMRFEQVASRAVAEGYDAICSTLTISPYQYTDIILEELQRAANAHGLHAELRDFSSCYPEATRRSIENGMYRQNCCGCRFSMAEAAQEREKRKAWHKLLKKLRRLQQDVADRVKEREIVDGYKGEAQTLRYEPANLCALMGFEDALSTDQLVSVLKSAQNRASAPEEAALLSTLEFNCIADHVEVLVPQSSVTRIHDEGPNLAFLEALVAFLAATPQADRSEVEALFAKHSRKFELRDLPQDCGFSFSVRFKNPQIDTHYYCFKENVRTAYLRLNEWEYARLVN